MKTIWLINQYAMPPKYEVRVQTLKRAQYLLEYGYDVTIIGGSYLHNTDINLISDKNKYFRSNYGGIKYIHVKTSKYRGNGISRFYNMLAFSFRLLLLSNNFGKPDVIVQTATVPFGNILYYLAKKYQSKYIIEVVDLWPESFLAMGLISKHNPLLLLAYNAEKWLYRKANKIVFSMEGGKDYIVEKGWDLDSGGDIDLNKVHYINNGVDLAEFDRNKGLYKFSDIDLDNDTIFKVIYLGSIRLANDLKQLIDAAEMIQDIKNIKILIYGDGNDRHYLETYCKDKGITNVVFKQKWVELKYVPYILSKSSLNILNYKKNPIFRYGGSQSKSFQYMASGKPILSNAKMGYCPITNNNMGISEEFKTTEEYASAILAFYKMNPKDYQRLCLNARESAEKYDYKKLTVEFEQLIK